MSRKRFSLDKFPELLKNPPHDIDIMLYDKKKKGSTHHLGDNIVKKPTLSQRLDELTEIVKDGFKRVNTRIDNLETRIDRIDARLDYIVKANNLKDSK